MRTKEEVISIVTGKPVVRNEVLPVKTIVGKPLVYEGIPGAPITVTEAVTEAVPEVVSSGVSFAGLTGEQAEALEAFGLGCSVAILRRIKALESKILHLTARL